MDCRILFVDDDEGILKLFKHQFGKKYSIDLANNADAGLKYLKEKGPYCIIIADLRMPGMNGIDFLEQVKILHPETVRMMLTGNADLETAIEAINKDSIFRFLTKPIKKEEFIYIIEEGLKKYEEDQNIRNESYKDPMTGIWNRRYFDIQIKKELLTAQRKHDLFSIVFIDINSFKHINDHFGHDIGDKAIILVAETLQEKCRKSDTVARYGGDEFVILTSRESKFGAIGMVLRIKKLVESRSMNSDVVPKMSLAAGIATYPFDGKNIERFLKVADENMYEDKLLEKKLSNTEKESGS
jgi:two-component system, cell cycle response regulator